MKAWILVGVSVLFACGPEKGGSSATASGASDSSGEVGVTDTGATVTTGAPTVTGDSTTGDSTTGDITTGDSTTGGSTTGGDSTTGGGPAVPFVYRFAAIAGRPSALENIPNWPVAWEFDCPAVMDPPCGTMPTLGEPQFLVDGAFADPETITIGSRVAVLIPFEDPACALRCGSLVAEVTDGVEGDAGFGSTPSNLPCSTAESGLWLALDFGEIQRDGLHTGQQHMVDVCEAPTEQVKVAFTPK